MLTGSFTALVTPFRDGGVDYEGLEQLVDFQIENGITGILAVGTTGESPVLSWEEHNHVIERIAKRTKNKCICIAGTGSNNTRETLEATKHAAAADVDAVLLVDPYYNGPSSLEIRKEYVEPVAETFADLQVIPYVIPGRTGAQLLPEDLALLHKGFANVNTVKEATGNIENMKRTRECCGSDFSILSGDDGMTYPMMTHPQINAAGVISVASNVAPKAVTQMVHLLQQGNATEGQKLAGQARRLFRSLLDPHEIAVRRIVAVAAPQKQLRKSFDRGQQVVEIVGDSSGQFSHRLHLLSLQQLFLGGLQLFQALHEFGNDLDIQAMGNF